MTFIGAGSVTGIFTDGGISLAGDLDTTRPCSEMISVRNSFTRGDAEVGMLGCGDTSAVTVFTWIEKGSVSRNKITEEALGTEDADTSGHI